MLLAAVGIGVTLLRHRAREGEVEGSLILYLAPHFLVMALPIAFLLAILLGLGRLAEDRELTALQALVPPRVSSARTRQK